MTVMLLYVATLVIFVALDLLRGTTLSMLLYLLRGNSGEGCSTLRYKGRQSHYKELDHKYLQSNQAPIGAEGEDVKTQPTTHS